MFRVFEKQKGASVQSVGVFIDRESAESFLAEIREEHLELESTATAWIEETVTQKNSVAGTYSIVAKNPIVVCENESCGRRREFKPELRCRQCEERPEVLARCDEYGNARMIRDGFRAAGRDCSIVGPSPLRREAARVSQRPEKGQPARHQAWIVSIITGRCFGYVKGESKLELLSNAIVMMSELVPDLTDARAQFRLSTTRPADQKAFENRNVPTFPWGRYRDCPLSSIPTASLDRMLDSSLQQKDPILFDAIETELRTRTEWSDTQWHEENGVLPESNYLRDLRLDDKTGQWTSDEPNRLFGQRIR